MAVQAIPEGYQNVTPVLIVEGAAKLIDFITTVFGGQERPRMSMPDGSVAHAEITVGDSMIMVSDATEQFPATTASLHVYVGNVDDVFKRAVAAGATVEGEPEDHFYGDRSGAVRDAFGNRWSISTHVEDVAEDEMERRMTAMFAQQGA
jgi:PhnB protein